MKLRQKTHQNQYVFEFKKKLHKPFKVEYPFFIKLKPIFDPGDISGRTILNETRDVENSILSTTAPT